MKLKEKLSKKLKGADVVMIITDQQTWKQLWDPKWGKNPKNFPAMTKLLKNGIAFENAYCNTCTCTSSRTTLFTGAFPAQHRATQVLAIDDPYNEKYPPNGYTQVMQGVMPNNYQNIFRMMESAGYEVVYKGKWHVSKPTKFLDQNQESTSPLSPPMNHLYWSQDDVEHLENMYGIKGWNFPDAGDDANIYNFGGGDVEKGGFNNDGRFVDGHGQSGWYGKELPGMDERETTKANIKASAVNFIRTYKSDKPLFLVVSLVNPHDVLSYPGNETVSSTNNIPRRPPLYKLGGYRLKDFKEIKVDLPSTWNENLNTKPKIQKVWNTLIQGIGEIRTRKVALNYVKFYAYLTSLVDKEIDKVLDALSKNSRTKDALIIRVADHGDMAMSHGMMRQKMYNAYQQTINVPMIFSHPEIKKTSTYAMSGLIDIMPTLADIADISDEDKNKYKFHGKSLMDELDNPESPGQEYIHFTFDDDYTASAAPWNMGACHIRSIIQNKGDEKWKYSVYFDPNYNQDFEYEMYNLTWDPDEKYNLAFDKLDKVLSKMGNYIPKLKRAKKLVELKRAALHQKLIDMMIEKGTLPDSVVWPAKFGEQ